MINLERAFETDSGVIVNGLPVISSILEAANSVAPSYSGDKLTSSTYYLSLTQINANRIADVTYTYNGVDTDRLDQETYTFYETDGLTAYAQVQVDYTYSGDSVTDIEVTLV